MSHKKRYTCDIFDHIFAYNFWMVNAMAMKFCTHIETHTLHISMCYLTILMLLFFTFTLMKEKDAFLLKSPICILKLLKIEWYSYYTYTKAIWLCIYLCKKELLEVLLLKATDRIYTRVVRCVLCIVRYLKSIRFK